MTEASKTAKTQDYTFRAKNVVISKQGVQATGPNAGAPYVMGSFQKEKDGVTKTVMFKAFDGTSKAGNPLTSATRINQMVAEGTNEFYVKGGFVDGRPRDANDPSKGRFSDFQVRFVETVESRAAFVEAQKAKKAAAAPQEQAAEQPEAVDEEVGF
jgi:hypothetical protein